MAKKAKKRVKKICIAQINYNSENIQRHVERVKNIINNYKSYDLIVFPELILHGHPSFEKPEGFLFRKMKVMYSAISRDLYPEIGTLVPKQLKDISLSPVARLKRLNDLQPR